MLINGDAARVPLRDGSVQCVVTSPPYWGLRDYGLSPLVWGGAAGCVHRWGDKRKIPATTHWNTGGVYNPEERKEVQAESHNGQFCQHCQAWRGSLGLEPTPDCERPFVELRPDLTEKEREYVMSELERLGVIDTSRQECDCQR